jgi:hypothetical protein
LWSTSATHRAQNVHSYEQMRASIASGGNALLQFSQVGLSSSKINTIPQRLYVSTTDDVPAFDTEPKTPWDSKIVNSFTWDAALIRFLHVNGERLDHADF